MREPSALDGWNAALFQADALLPGSTSDLTILINAKTILGRILNESRGHTESIIQRNMTDDLGIETHSSAEKV